jgi:hypothetical protein
VGRADASAQDLERRSRLTGGGRAIWESDELE